MSLWWLMALAWTAPLDCEAVTPLIEANVPADTLARTLEGSTLTPELRRCIEAAGADAAYLAILDEALVGSAAQPAAADPAPEPAKGDTAPAEDAPKGKVRNGWPYVRAAYGITWLMLLGYTASLWSRRPRQGGMT